jgi:O-antigen ligase
VVLSISAGLGTEVSLHELLITVLPCAGFLLLHWIDPKPERIVAALAASGTVMALIGVLQFSGLDPFRLIGLTGSLQGSSRIRVFSTMGNPNFVAALLTAVLPLTVLASTPFGSWMAPGKLRLWFAAAGAVQACGIFATGSRAPILGFLAAGIWLLIRKNRPWVRFFIPCLIVCAALILFSPARPLGKTIAGRIYMWRIISRHIAVIPPTGYGPGAFALRFARWEAETENPKRSAPASFAGLQDHAHNDYLEFLVDLGFIGLLGFGIVTVLLAALFRPAAGPPEIAATASLIALLSVAAVDFPLHRPAELYVFWTVSALLSIARGNAKRTHPVFASHLPTPRRTKQCVNLPESEF